MSIDMNEELPDPTPRGEDFVVQATLEGMAWVLRVTGSPVLLASLVRADLKDDAALAEIALSIRCRYIVEQVKALESGDITSEDCDFTAYAAHSAWEHGYAGISIEEAVLAQMAPIEVSFLG